MSLVRYQPLGPLLAGEGSRAFLGLALDTGAPPRPVVLVWAPPEVARDPDLTAGLQRETQRAAVLDHPNILRVHGLVTLEAGLARVTEFADGESLRRLLEVRPRIPPAFAALIASDVAMGAHYAHLAGNDDGTALVHGDLRPETVMVSFNGVCKVTGYGALSVAPRERNGRRVRNRRNYSAPEQLMGGREAVTARTDVFLLGLLLYECLTGRMPFQDTPDADQATISRQLPPLPSDIPKPLAEVVRTATAKRANDRYATALEFREAVVAAVQGLPSAETFAEFLAQLFPPDRDARATRRQMLEIGLAEASRRLSGAGMPIVQPAPPPPAYPATRPISVSVPPVESPEPLESDDIPVDIALQDEDADAIDSVMELTGRHSRPGIARPLSREEPTPPLREPIRPLPLDEPKPKPKALLEDDELPRPNPKRRSRVPLMVGALAATAAAATGGLFLWNERQQAARPADPGVVPVAATPPAAPAPANADGLAASAGTTGSSPASAQPAPTEDGGASPATASSVVAAGGPPPAAPAGAVVPVSGTASAPPPSSGNTDTPEAPSTAQPAVTTRLQLFVLPPVDVSLDGKRLGRTPMAVPLAPGAYTLELSNPAKGVRTTRAITVRPEGTTIQRFLLGRGTVQVRAPAGSRIFLDGRKVGPKLSLFEGEHQLVVTTGKDRWEKSFRLEPRQKVTFDVEYQKP
ncbi:serine/threonine-protein kinase [Archangium lipolyticum]|uniref:serine/threonine-protein kinase n=1 Tax=Archangium lipolyticum TaxID=2970465 RepID=UPI0021499A6B|nr:serine/threonine-protein kinase [Archangium lipolyticum]